MISQICKWIVFKCIYPFVYFVGSRRRIDSKKIVFVESHGDRISDDFKLLFEETQMQGYKPFVHYLRISESAWSRIIVRTVRMIWNISTAKCVFLKKRCVCIYFWLLWVFVAVHGLSVVAACRL